jgi:hypothetical protein
MDRFCLSFEAAIPQLKQQIMAAFGRHQSQAGFRSVWEDFEDVINPVLITFLTSAPLSIPTRQIIEASSKSVYPDLKVENENKLYAIDVKSGEDGRNPWYDIGRLDTYEETHLDKYAAEYCITVRWVGRPVARVVDVYIEPTYRSVGYRPAANGVLYRPYDGKLRPKSWIEFETGVSHWRDMNHFREGLANSRQYRQRAYMVEWYKSMNREQRRVLREDFTRYEAGQTVDLDADAHDTDANNT